MSIKKKNSLIKLFCSELSDFLDKRELSKPFFEAIAFIEKQKKEDVFVDGAIDLNNLDIASVFSASSIKTSFKLKNVLKLNKIRQIPGLIAKLHKHLEPVAKAGLDPSSFTMLSILCDYKLNNEMFDDFTISMPLSTISIDSSGRYFVDTREIISELRDCVPDSGVLEKIEEIFNFIPQIRSLQE